MRNLTARIKEKDSVLCVGIDPVIDRFPASIREADVSISEKLVSFSKLVIDATLEEAVCYKPQLAYFEMYGLEGMKAFKETLAYLREKNAYVICDAKRGDIGSTATAYGEAFLRKGADFEGDALTINPYLGDDSSNAFYEICEEEEKSVFMLVKTSNPTSDQFQNKTFEGKTLYELVAETITSKDERGDFIGAVVGATHPEELKKMREEMPNTMFLIPGYGAQGGKAEDIKVGFGDDGLKAVVNSSRGIIYAYEKSDLEPKEAILVAAKKAKEELNGVRHAI